MSELGNRLREAREEEGLTIEELQVTTKIQKRYLLALEEGNYEIIPGKFYIRAFIKQYAEAVGLSADQLFEEYKKEIPSTYNDDVTNKLSSIKSKRELPKSASKILEFMPTILVVTGIIVVIAIVYALYQMIGDHSSHKEEDSQLNQAETKYEITDNSALSDTNKQERATEPSEHTDKQEEQPQSKPEVKVTSKSGQNTTYEVTGGKMELELVPSKNVWIKVRNAKGVTIKEGEIKKGEPFKQDLSSEPKIDLRIGYTPNVEIRLNGEALQYGNDPKSMTTQNITILNKEGEQSS